METTEEQLRKSLLNLTATTIPLCGIVAMLEERTNLPESVKTLFTQFQESLVEAVLLLPEAELKETTLALIPDEESIESREVAVARMNTMLQKARELSAAKQAA